MSRYMIAVALLLVPAFAFADEKKADLPQPTPEQRKAVVKKMAVLTATHTISSTNRIRDLKARLVADPKDKVDTELMKKEQVELKAIQTKPLDYFAKHSRASVGGLKVGHIGYVDAEKEKVISADASSTVLEVLYRTSGAIVRSGFQVQTSPGEPKLAEVTITPAMKGIKKGQLVNMAGWYFVADWSGDAEKGTVKTKLVPFAFTADELKEAADLAAKYVADPDSLAREQKAREEAAKPKPKVRK